MPGPTGLVGGMKGVSVSLPEPEPRDQPVMRGRLSASEPYVDRKQLASIMGVSVATVDRMVRAGMPSETWGLRSRRFKPSLALAWAQERGGGR
jgi:hypothetical protein